MTNQPNVLVIYPDQMRYDCTGAAGNTVVKTPNIDRLAAAGAFFERAYTSFPLCCPFRASFMTGKYAHSNGMYANHYPIALGQRWLADCFNEAGYATGYVGKWHLNGGPKYDHVPKEYRCGFERFIGFSRGHQYFDPIFYRDDDPTPRTSKKYEADVQTEHLIEIIQDAGDRGRPFFTMINYGIPHPPLQMPEHYSSMYDPVDMPLRDCTPPEEEARARKFMAGYYGLCTCVDDNVGRVLNWIDERGLADDTIVMLVSDHGEMAREFGLGGKKNYHDASMHVPYIIRQPGQIEAGQRLNPVVDPAVDSAATLLELCGIDAPDGIQGDSLAPCLHGESSGIRDFVYYEILKEEEGPEKFPVPERGVRTADWLYVRHEDGPLALYDLRTDPLEMNNLVGGPDCLEPIRELDARLTLHMQETGDDWGRKAVFPPPNFMSHDDAPAFHDELLKRVVLED